MFEKKSAKPAVSTILTLTAAVIGVSAYFLYNLNSEAELYETSKAETIALFDNYEPEPYVNSTYGATPYISQADREDGLYFFDAPEGFTIVSLSPAWNRNMLQALYEELKRGEHGDEMQKLYEIVIYPDEDNEANALATYSPGISTASFFIQFPAFPTEFSVNFPIYTGKISIFGGDTNTTVESVAGSLSHEYGHHYTFYYMFDHALREQNLLGQSRYGQLRDYEGFELIESAEIGEDYLQNRHKYLIETAAEDYVTLMGSPASRYVIDYYDVRQLLENPELDGTRRGGRNAFPQENMMIPLAIDVPGLAEYFYSFIDAEPRVPVEEKQNIELEFTRDSEEYNLESGPRVFTHYDIRWDMPYEDAIYTLACYDPHEYTGWGIPIKTVRPGDYSRGRASAVVGEYAVLDDNMVHFRDDGLATGIKVFYVVALLPDGTYYLSDPTYFNFG